MRDSLTIPLPTIPNNPQANLSPLLPDPEIAEFLTVDLLRDQLVVIDNYLACTPNTPITEAKRKRLVDERVQLEAMINEHMISVRKAIPSNSDVGTVHSENDDGPESPSLNTALAPLAGVLTDTQFSVSGFSTPDIFPNRTCQRDVDPFASVREEPLLSLENRLEPETT